MFKLKFKCGCGAYNYNFQDWISHFKYGRGFMRSLTLLLNTRIELNR